MRSAESCRIKNINGDCNIESGGDVLIDGAHGTMQATSETSIDIHLDSSFGRGSFVAKEKIIIRTPPDQNKHKFVIKKGSVIKFDGFDASTLVENEFDSTIVLVGKNTAGHPRKTEFMEFEGVITLDAPEVVIQAESWMQKQLMQKKRFPKVEKKAESTYRFY